MALRKIVGPFEFKDLFGDYRPVDVDFWCDELDGFLAYSTWKATSAGGADFYGRGILQLDGTFTPRRPNLAGTDGVPYYDMARRRLAWFYGSPARFELGGDWATLYPPYGAEQQAYNIADDGVHWIDPFSRMFLPDRMIFIGYKIESEFYVGPYETKIFSLAYGATTPPVVEHVIYTEKDGVQESWRPYTSFTCRFVRSGTPQRSVFLIRNYGYESKAVEYDFIAKKTVGWVRRLGDQPTLDDAAGEPGAEPPHLIGFSCKHGFWLVQDNIPDPVWNIRKRISLFADDPVPATLSNPLALAPVRAGDVVSFQVRLLGADGEPCEGHRVAWTRTGLGTVLDGTTTTDADGYAKTRVAFEPRGDGPWEGTTINAEVLF